MKKRQMRRKMLDQKMVEREKNMKLNKKAGELMMMRVIDHLLM
jgi:hypothetical protein